jgi:hypothetical protein
LTAKTIAALDNKIKALDTTVTALTATLTALAATVAALNGASGVGAIRKDVADNKTKIDAKSAVFFAIVPLFTVISAVFFATPLVFPSTIETGKNVQDIKAIKKVSDDNTSAVNTKFNEVRGLITDNATNIAKNVKQLGQQTGWINKNEVAIAAVFLSDVVFAELMPLTLLLIASLFCSVTSLSALM